MLVQQAKLLGLLLVTASLLSGCLARKAPSLIDRSGQQNRPNDLDVNRSFDKYGQKRILDRIFSDRLECNASNSTRPSEPQLRLLTAREYEWSISDIFGTEVSVQSILPAEPSLMGFRNIAFFRLITAEHFEAFLRAAETVSQVIISSPAINQINCGGAQLDPGCASRFLENFGELMWRRPLTEEEKINLGQLFQGSSNQEALASMIQGLLISSQFLYRHEIGAQGRLDPYEVASSLSYGIWGSGPDRNLLNLAANGSLLNPSTLESELNRLLNDPKSKRGLSEMANAWLGYQNILNVHKDQNVFPQIQSESRQSFAAETENFFHHIVVEERGNFADLFMADYTIGGQDLATFYEGVFQGNSRVQLNGEQRRGLLGHASILASYSSSTETHPVKRGEFVMEHIYCDVQLPTPAGLEVQVPPPDPNATTRERFAIHTQDPNCAACHVKLDGVGFGMEDMDGIGRFRTIDQGLAVDASGEILRLTMEEEQSFFGTAELSGLIANSKRAQICYTVHWFRMLHGRFEGEDDICHIRQVGEDFANNSRSSAELILNLLSHSQFMDRSAR